MIFYYLLHNCHFGSTDQEHPFDSQATSFISIGFPLTSSHIDVPTTIPRPTGKLDVYSWYLTILSVNSYSVYNMLFFLSNVSLYFGYVSLKHDIFKTLILLGKGLRFSIFNPWRENISIMRLTWPCCF